MHVMSRSMRYKINICQHRGRVHLYQDGEHLGEIFELKTHGISERVKYLIEDLIEKLGNQPKQITTTVNYKYLQHTAI